MCSLMLWGTLPMGWVLGGSWVLWSALPWLTPRPCLLLPRIGPTPQDAGDSVVHWLGDVRLSPTVRLWGLGLNPIVDGCCGAPYPVGAVGWPGIPRAPMEFPASWLLKSLIKTLLYFFPWLRLCLSGGQAPGWQYSRAPSSVRCLPTHSWGTHVMGGTEKGALTVIVPVKGGHLPNGTAVAILELPPSACHAGALLCTLCPTMAL